MEGKSTKYVVKKVKRKLAVLFLAGLTAAVVPSSSLYAEELSDSLAEEDYLLESDELSVDENAELSSDAIEG